MVFQNIIVVFLISLDGPRYSLNAKLKMKLSFIISRMEINPSRFKIEEKYIINVYCFLSMIWNFLECVPTFLSIISLFIFFHFLYIYLFLCIYLLFLLQIYCFWDNSLFHSMIFSIGPKWSCYPASLSMAILCFKTRNITLMLPCWIENFHFFIT